MSAISDEMAQFGITPDEMIRDPVFKDLDDTLYRMILKKKRTENANYAKKLVIKYRDTARKQVDEYLAEAGKFRDLSKVLSTIRVSGDRYLTPDWARAVVCFAAIDIAAKRMASQLGISEKLADGRFKPTETLLGDINKKTRKGPSKLPVIKALTEEYRDVVLHEGYLVTTTGYETLFTFLKDLLGSFRQT